MPSSLGAVGASTDGGRDDPSGANRLSRRATTGVADAIVLEALWRALRGLKLLVRSTLASAMDGPWVGVCGESRPPMTVLPERRLATRRGRVADAARLG